MLCDEHVAAGDPLGCPSSFSFGRFQFLDVLLRKCPFSPPHKRTNIAKVQQALILVAMLSMHFGKAFFFTYDALDQLSLGSLRSSASCLADPPHFLNRKRLHLFEELRGWPHFSFLQAFDLADTYAYAELDKGFIRRFQHVLQFPPGLSN